VLLNYQLLTGKYLDVFRRQCTHIFNCVYESVIALGNLVNETGFRQNGQFV